MPHSFQNGRKGKVLDSICDLMTPVKNQCKMFASKFNDLIFLILFLHVKHSGWKGPTGTLTGIIPCDKESYDNYGYAVYDAKMFYF